MPCFTIPIHESNDCHLPAGSPEGGQFCSGGMFLPVPPKGSVGVGTPEGSAELPDYLKGDVARAARAGIVTHHRQQPEPVKTTSGEIVDPLALSHAERGETTYTVQGKGITFQRAPTGRIQITTRGGVYEPEYDAYESSGDFWNIRRKKKDLTPEDLPEDAKRSAEDVVSTFRHEMGHILRKAGWPDRSFKAGTSTPYTLASEINAWQYAVEISPNHEVSERMVRDGLMSHGYFEFRLRQLRTGELKRTPLYDFEEVGRRWIDGELKQGVVNIEAHRQAVAFTNKAARALKNYGAVLRKKGLQFTVQRRPYIPKREHRKGLHAFEPGPGGRGQV